MSMLRSENSAKIAIVYDTQPSTSHLVRDSLLTLPNPMSHMIVTVALEEKTRVANVITVFLDVNALRTSH